ncbi:MAG: PilZ domain-containing protein [Deltaproteobacteria bacterium]|nr:PilZ domain-containing protein [Deltaproteobacteria bacterium]
MTEPDDRRVFPRRPIRLRVAYKKAHTLVTEYTKTISKGGCCIVSKQGLPLGTVFVFEMYAHGLGKPAVVEGEVVRCDPADGQFELGIRYVVPEEKRASIEAVLDKIFSEHQWERARAHPRIPVNLAASDARDAIRKYLITDLSRGGFGLCLQDHSLPAGVIPGTPVLLHITVEEVGFDLSAEVVWVNPASPGQARLGCKFVDLSDGERKVVQVLERLGRPSLATVEFFA